ncbi:hypothetical protein CLV92_11760 [Kineococcus xinjiangensis]|uniref:Uncharacterized protein n=1 Tax=Kineococcus xinjiangensis TaxID=512762 RepID=A0A2S6ID02_9ACTN|nr:hypothetical protein [Kineococcus xinjiangensis]PPK92095.1 hypothetical protein CLV92_11760 [Kineococcus xinjiangensis]
MSDEQPDVYDLDRIARMVLAMDPADVHRLTAGTEGGPGLAGAGHGDGRALAVYPPVGERGLTVARDDATELVRRILDHRLVEGSLSEQQHDQMLTEAIVGLNGLV